MNNIFIIPDTENQFIVYLPILGILFKANGSALNLFQKALDGDIAAQKQFGLTPRQIDKFNKKEKVGFTQKINQVKFKPTTVSLFLTSDCSMKCVYCYASAGENSNQIKMEYIKIAINEVINNAILLNRKSISVNYHGGGDIGVAWPLVEKSTEYIRRQASANNLKVAINVGLNGVLSEYQREWIVNNIHSATVSIDGDKNIQNKLRPLKNGKSSFDIVHDTLTYFDQNGFNYTIRSTVTAETVGELEKIITFFCENYKVHKIKIEPVFIQGRAGENMVNMPLASDFIKSFIESEKIASQYDKELLYSGARFEVLSNIFCLAAGSSFGITTEGYITSCYEVLDLSNPASEIFIYGKIEDGKIVIFQDKLDALASFTVENKEKCQNCFAKYHCAGDCPVKSILAETNENISNYRCEINRELTKNQLLKALH